MGAARLPEDRDRRGRCLEPFPRRSGAAVGDALGGLPGRAPLAPLDPTRRAERCRERAHLGGCALGPRALPRAPGAGPMEAAPHRRAARPRGDRRRGPLHGRLPSRPPQPPVRLLPRLPLQPGGGRRGGAPARLRRRSLGPWLDRAARSRLRCLRPRGAGGGSSRAPRPRGLLGRTTRTRRHRTGRRREPRAGARALREWRRQRPVRALPRGAGALRGAAGSGAPARSLQPLHAGVQLPRAALRRPAAPAGRAVRAPLRADPARRLRRARSPQLRPGEQLDPPPRCGPRALPDRRARGEAPRRRERLSPGRRDRALHRPDAGVTAIRRGRAAGARGRRRERRGEAAPPSARHRRSADVVQERVQPRSQRAGV